MRVGVARGDITPVDSVWLTGYAHRDRKSEGVYHPLRAGAVYMEGSDDAGLIVTADVIGFDLSTAAAAKLQIAAATGLLPRQIVLTATHTHGGPFILPMALPGEIEAEYAEFLRRRLVEIAMSARTTAVAGHIRSSRGRSEFGVNRRLPDGRGGVEFAPNPGGPIDRDLDTLWFEDDAGTTLGTLTVYGCHATSLGDHMVGGDYPGYLCTALERSTGAPAFFAAGCAGDVRPWYTLDSAQDFGRPSLDELEAAGDQMADEVLASREGAIDVDGESLQLACDYHHLPYAQLPSRQELTSEAEDGSDSDFRKWARVMLSLCESGALPTSCPHEIQILRFNPDCFVLFLGGEILSEVGQHLKQRLQPAHAVTAAYSNGLIGYLPSENAYDLGGYEVDGSYRYFLRPAPFTKDVERLIVDKTMAMVSDFS